MHSSIRKTSTGGVFSGLVNYQSTTRVLGGKSIGVGFRQDGDSIEPNSFGLSKAPAGMKASLNLASTPWYVPQDAPLGRPRRFQPFRTPHVP